MKDKTHTIETVSRSGFLEKFAGKVNVITKHGQITDEKGVKLPLINQLGRRSNTMLFRSSKQPVYSFSSQGNRNIPFKPGTIKPRAQKYLTHNPNPKILSDLSNSFLKKSHQNPSTTKHKIIEPLQQPPMNHYPISQRQDIHLGYEKRENERYSEYEQFLGEVEGIRKIGRGRRFGV